MLGVDSTVVVSDSSAMISVHRLTALQNEGKSAAIVAGGKRNFTEESIRMEKLQAIQQRAVELFEKETDWATFFREVLGVNGIVHRTYPTPRRWPSSRRRPSTRRSRDAIEAA